MQDYMIATHKVRQWGQIRRPRQDSVIENDLEKTFNLTRDIAIVILTPQLIASPSSIRLLRFSIIDHKSQEIARRSDSSSFSPRIHGTSTSTFDSSCHLRLSPANVRSQENFDNEFVQEQEIMQLDPSHEQINGPLTPASPGTDKSGDLRMNVDEDDNKVKFTHAAVGLKEFGPHLPETDSSHLVHDKIMSADDRKSLFCHEVNCSR